MGRSVLKNGNFPATQATGKAALILWDESVRGSIKMTVSIGGVSSVAGAGSITTHQLNRASRPRAINSVFDALAIAEPQSTDAAIASAKAAMISAATSSPKVGAATALGLNTLFGTSSS